MTNELKVTSCGRESMAQCDTDECTGRLMDKVTMKITRGQKWEVAPHACDSFQIRSRVQGTQSGINTGSDHTYYSLEGKMFTISKPHTSPDDTYVKYNEITSYEIPRRGVSPDREIVNPERVIVLEQYHYAERGPAEQGGRESKRHTERFRSRDPYDSDTRHTNQRGCASARSGMNVRPPSPERHLVGTYPVSCSEDEQGPQA